MNIIIAIYVHFRLTKCKDEILRNPIPQKYSLQLCMLHKLGQSYQVFLSYQKLEKLTFKVPDGRSHWQVSKF